MSPQSLSDDAFKATFMAPMRDVTADPGEVIDIWDYVAAVPAGDLEGRTPQPPLIQCVYRSADGAYDHVLVITDAPDVYLVIVIDRTAMRVHGHRLLDLPQDYGLKR